MNSYVVTGGAQGVGRAIVERLAADGSAVVVLDPAGPGAAPMSDSIRFVVGDASDPEITRRAADEAESQGPLVGWVNNAAVFPEASLTTTPAAQVLEGITTNLAMAVTGCHTAVNHFVSHGRPGAIVNVSSHQAQRPVRGALPYATAKAAIEGLTRALAVDHGPDGVRTNAVALGSISTDRYEAYRDQHPDVDRQMADLHPLGRVGRAHEVAETVAFLLAEQAAFVNGAVLPVDGGRSVNGPDPEAR
jgi:NAD(P)-dependent dehydrogenase (short-subunit alcohol dehydrogenase family)